MGGETGPEMAAPPSYPKMVERPVAKQIHSIYTDRLRQFTDQHQFYDQGLLSKMYYERVHGGEAVRLSVWSAPDLTRPSFAEATSSSNTYKRTTVGSWFGPSWSTHWFHVKLKIPKELQKYEHLEFQWDANNEGLVWDEDGHPLQGLTGGGERTEWIIPKKFRDGQEHTIYVEMACNGMFGNAPPWDTNQPPDPNKFFQLAKADIVAVNETARQLYIDFWIIGDAAREFPGESWEQHKALQVCNNIMDCFIAEGGTDECLAHCRKIAQSYIGTKVDSAKVYDNSPAFVMAIGNCHIDSCWLWPFDETKRKVARSWMNQCDLLDRYPEHRFVASQAQQFAWLKQLYPWAFDRVKSKVKEGTFQPIGGSWVEHDTNLPSGESLVRQFVYGQRFFESNFGKRCRTFWLPDTFGYSAQLPQLCRLAGMSRFFTQKLSWNNINNFPHSTFNWVALDGSQVLCHMAPSNTYTALANFGDVQRSLTQHKSKDQDPTSILAFGKGDGGGGPTWEMLEKLRRCRGMSDTTGRLPKVKMGDSVDDFYDMLQYRAEHGTDFVTWYGELYFELHRGTYTTQSNNKRNNRRAEVMLHDIEFLATMASLKGVKNVSSKHYKYPKKEIDFMWESVLLCQFHDCLPGSSIEMCYRDSDKIYAELFKTGEKLLKDAFEVLGFESPSKKSNGNLVAINTLPYDSPGLVKLPAGLDSEYAYWNGAVGLDKIPEEESTLELASIVKANDTTYTLGTHELRVVVKDGAITSIFDRANSREILKKGCKGEFVIFDDKPLFWQAWDVEIYHLRSRKAIAPPHKIRISERGPYRVGLEMEQKISDVSSIRTVISLSARRPGTKLEEPLLEPLEISSFISWHENKNFLKFELPVDIMNTSASYETQFGVVQRPTHYNTSWDTAKFEVCHHRWADLSEHDYGVSVLNDGKYGFATVGNVMRLSLLRSPKAPDGHADMGNHHVRFGILPHRGALGPTTVRAARMFNNPVTVPFEGNKQGVDGSDALFPFTSLSSYVFRHKHVDDVRALLGAIRLTSDSSKSLVIDTIKRGEDDADVRRADDDANDTMLPIRPVAAWSSGQTIVLRVCDTLGGHSRGTVSLGSLPVKSVEIVNLLEDDITPDCVEAGESTPEVEMFLNDDGSNGTRFRIELRPFEVKSFRLCM